MKRTHDCGQLTKADIGASVALAGWVDTIRDQGGIMFVDLRDRKGVTQVKLEPPDDEVKAKLWWKLKPESVISVTGVVTLRPAGTANTAHTASY